MKTRVFHSAVGVFAASLVFASVQCLPAAAKDGTPATSTDPALLASQQKLAPLRALADALGAQGRGRFDDTYTDVHIDATHGLVDLYATSRTRAEGLIAAAQRGHADLQWSHVQVLKSEYSKLTLDRQIARIMTPANMKAMSLVSASPAPAGKGISVVVASGKLHAAEEPQMSRSLEAGSSVPVSISAGPAIKAATWRWNDTQPYIGGDVVLGNAWESGYINQCTTGLAVESPSGTDFITTAAHCYSSGTRNYGEGDTPTGNFGYNYGSYIGQTSAVSPHWDAELIEAGGSNGSGSNSDEADAPSGKYYKVTSYAYSYGGDGVCQDGARSYYTGHGVPCGINVSNDDVTYSLSYGGSTYAVRGVEGKAPSGYAVTAGDSGGLVFTVTGSSTRQARGSVSASSGAGTMYWTETTDIFNALYVKLNPHT